MNKIKIATILLILLVGGGVTWYVFRPAPTSVASKKVDVKINDIPTFLAEFEVDEEQANGKYLNKIIEVQGVVSEQSKEYNSLTIQGNDFGGVVCNFQPKYSLPEILEGQTVIVKGRCAGFLLVDVQLMDCAVQKANGSY